MAYLRNLRTGLGLGSGNSNVWTGNSNVWSGISNALNVY
jgi:hypothetical protein